ncbi:hypothetical protein GCM10010492_49160 [Saccharothrix mutabilis subsp. mutabilis]|uniref:DUF3558 domain-containing protein n=1 Tax=Saccharothrix mutabilis subsp. mutabilis TaxID=66855 RepID=A0ABP3DZB3_9PSEU
MRRSTTLTATLALALVLGLSACATTVTGSAKPAAGGSSAAKTTSGKPSATKESTSGRKTAVSTTVTKPGSSGGSVKVGTRKKSEGYDSCELLTPQDVAEAVGARKPGDPGCVQSTDEPFTLVLFRVGFDTTDDQERREFEIGGNTAYEVQEEGGSCTVVVVLDEPGTVGLTPAFTANVTPIDDSGKPCEAALKLATKGFEKIPNA